MPEERRISRAGVTLLELLVAAGIVAVLSMAVVTALVAGLRLWDRAERFEGARAEAALAGEIVARDFRNRVPFFAAPFMGEADGCVFATLADTGGVTRLAVVEYRFERARGVLWRRMANVPEAVDSVREETLVSGGLTAGRFAYLTRPAADPEAGAVPPGWNWSGRADGRSDEVGGIRMAFVGEAGHESFEFSTTALRP